MSGRCPCDCGGKGYLLDQTYGEADIPAGWTPVQACDQCGRYQFDTVAARVAASERGVDRCFFPAASDEPGDWAIHWEDRPVNIPVEQMTDMALGWELACAALGISRTPPERHDALAAEWERRGLTHEQVARQIEEHRL